MFQRLAIEDDEAAPNRVRRVMDRTKNLVKNRVKKKTDPYRKKFHEVKKFFSVQIDPDETPPAE